MAPSGDSLFERVDQIGVVVRDLDECVRTYEKVLGENAFVTVEGEEPAVLAGKREVIIRGKLAFAQLGSVQLELIEIKDGPSIHLDFLEKNGEGIHHVGILVSDFDARLKEFRDRGIDILQQGKGMRRYAYLDTKPIMLELIEAE
jgi:catechol 2,3-dioxygenase-like lactoylglutathione lyase family enzyme